MPRRLSFASQKLKVLNSRSGLVLRTWIIGRRVTAINRKWTVIILFVALIHCHRVKRRKSVFVVVKILFFFYLFGCSFKQATIPRFQQSKIPYHFRNRRLNVLVLALPLRTPGVKKGEDARIKVADDQEIK